MKDAVVLLERLAVTGAIDVDLLGRLPSAERRALISGDAAALRDALGVPEAMICSIYAPDEDAPAEEPLQPDERPDEQEPNAA